jgi:hypothetical protein
MNSNKLDDIAGDLPQGSRARADGHGTGHAAPSLAGSHPGARALPGQHPSFAARSELSSGASLSVDGALAVAAEEPAPDSDEPVTREQRRSRRKRAVRARTISVKRMTKRELELGRMLFPETDYAKPVSRAECAEGMRPCPFVSCKYHLYLDVQPRTGAIKLNFPDIEVEDMHESCALDVADRHGTTLEEVGAIMNLTRERIRQLEVRAMAKVKALSEMESLRDFVDEGPVGKRRLPMISVSPAENDEAEGDDEGDESDLDDEVEAPPADEAGFDFAEE